MKSYYMIFYIYIYNRYILEESKSNNILKSNFSNSNLDESTKSIIVEKKNNKKEEVIFKSINNNLQGF